MRFRDHTQRHNTVGRTTLDEWSARRRDLTTHNTHKSKIHAPVGFKPAVPTNERPQTLVSDWYWLAVCRRLALFYCILPCFPQSYGIWSHLVGSLLVRWLAHTLGGLWVLLDVGCWFSEQFTPRLLGRIMNDKLYLRKEAFVPCESQPAAWDFGVLHVESPFGNAARQTCLHSCRKSVQERTLSSCFFSFSFWCKIRIIWKA